jgi:hypothetical protein
MCPPENLAPCEFFTASVRLCACDESDSAQTSNGDGSIGSTLTSRFQSYCSNRVAVRSSFALVRSFWNLVVVFAELESLGSMQQTRGGGPRE